MSTPPAAALSAPDSAAGDVVNLHDPKVWGPPFWRVYEIVADTYPHHPSKSEREAARKFFSSQKHLIPCATCVRNYRRIYHRYPPQVGSRHQLQEWVRLLKEQVAKHSKK